MKNTRIAMGIVSIALLASCTKNMNEKQLTFNEQIVPNEKPAFYSNRQSGENHVPNEVLVKFKKDQSQAGRANALGRISGRVKETILTKAMEEAGENEGLVLVHTPLDVLEAIGKLKGGLEIEFAEPNYVYTHDATSNDPYYTYGYLWGMYGGGTNPANQYGSNAGAAWAAGNTGGGSTVYIGIIDEGVMYMHDDLSSNFGNPKETAGNGKDDDGNGYVDDTFGWDFDGNNKTVYDGPSDDHGTHVAGTIGAKGGNGKGVAGVSWNVKMISAKFLGTNGGTTSNAIKSIDYFTDLKTRRGLNVVATNNSWGGGGYSQGLYDAIARANNAGILFIAAAGNGGSDGVGDNNDNVANYPSNYANSNIIAVAAITSNGSLASFSNFGATTVDIGAPGAGIYSTLPTSSNGFTYGSYSGTSMATPHVSGAAALYAAARSGVSAAQIKNAILSNAVATSSLSGKCVTGGRLNVRGF